MKRLVSLLSPASASRSWHLSPSAEASGSPLCQDRPSVASPAPSRIDAGDLGWPSHSDASELDPPLTDIAPRGAGGSPAPSQPPSAVAAPSQPHPALAAPSSYPVPSGSPPLSFTVILPPGALDYDDVAAFDSDDSSDTQTDTDRDDDIRRHYKVPVPSGHALRVSLRQDDTVLCPICPILAYWWRRLTKVRDHVLGQANTSTLRGANKKKYSRHRVLARNEGWM
ncbi:hypothetical protein PVAP13_8KG163602 [Panicum virgatum]|uniref:Uncharacterized protein n=1 Tax=Panicum virgatum TaxID=38727 RepID=A0A8T0PRB6_PANVG|nr:hypothetical protein PVAP13_8KG163602 [Panicum virgatum]